MRTTKRFSPDVLDRFRRQGRGIGTYDSYIPWHRVSRGDPSSRGRSHLPKWNGRHIELLSDKEFIGFFFTTRLLFASTKNDLREQFPLSLEENSHELAAYIASYLGNKFPGTLEIADKLDIKHPMTHGNGRSEPWVMTTDLLIMIQEDKKPPSFLAISIKDNQPITKRAKELLKIEKSYWYERDVPWLFLTPREYHPRVATTLQRTWPWAIENKVTKDHIKIAHTFLHNYQGSSLTFILNKISNQIGDYTLAQHSLWQSIWSGQSPIDLRRGWRPHLPLQIISQEAFDQLNPILVRRSTWI